MISNFKENVITCSNLNYRVNVRGSCFSLFSKPYEKLVLKSVNALFKNGTTAIMGPTGGGKSSLLDILADRKSTSGIEGTILMDGKERGLNFKSITGYVTQEDVIMGTLTVKENIMFSANMRLPSKLSKEIKKFMVEEVLDELGLTDVGDSRVGTEYLRGVSGGERKRTCIGMELIIRPSILFLDEPTSGLDSSTSYSVICLLNELAKKGRIVVLSIHQARYGIFKMIDNLLLLGNGSVIYHGPTENALPYFNSIGYQCEEFNNPADFFLDVINGDFDKTKSFIESSKEHNISISKGLSFKLSKCLIEKVDLSNKGVIS
ncbi:DgyrCDS7107 [Dimorphilus gyrociliatus]|uniref:DgyrCDS7107 n=1 Tax=Dimorphilus gyrociliatus TaxID=2664684 RepID=A0A7I8VQ97_9ANNE|nr:DgyrCDS7107 [Dimorphilus gyrociliatus]